MTPRIEQIKISLPTKFYVKVRLLPGPPRRVTGAPLHHRQQGLGELREATALAYSLRLRGSVSKIHVKFLEAVMTYFSSLTFTIQSQCKTPGKIKIKYVMGGAETRVFAKLRSSLPKQNLIGNARGWLGLEWFIYP